MSSGNFFSAKTSVALFLSFENCKKTLRRKPCIKAHVIDVKITWVANFWYPVTKSSNRTPVIRHPRDHAPITWQIGARRTNHDRGFCYRYNYGPIGLHSVLLSLHIFTHLHTRSFFWRSIWICFLLNQLRKRGTARRQVNTSLFHFPFINSKIKRQL